MLRKLSIFYTKRINNLHISIHLQLQLFDHTMVPILLYGCEIWGFQNTNLIELVHNQFMRNIMKSRKSKPLYMLYAELGRVSVDQHIKTWKVGYWISLVNGNESQFAKTESIP